MRRHTAEQAVLLSCGFLKLVVNVNRYRVGIVVRSEVGARCGGINRKRLHQPGPRRRYAVSVRGVGGGVPHTGPVADVRFSW